MQACPLHPALCTFPPMRFVVRYRQISLYVIVLAIMPLLFGHALHFLMPHEKGCSRFSARFARSQGHSDQEKHESDSAPASDHSCPVCDFLLMLRVATSSVEWECSFNLIARHESDSCRLFVALYRPFVPGRSPPGASQILDSRKFITVIPA